MDRAPSLTIRKIMMTLEIYCQCCVNAFELFKVAFLLQPRNSLKPVQLAHSVKDSKTSQQHSLHSFCTKASLVPAVVGLGFSGSEHTPHSPLHRYMCRSGGRHPVGERTRPLGRQLSQAM